MFVQVSCDQSGGEGGGEAKISFPITKGEGLGGLREGQIGSHDTWTAPNAPKKIMHFKKDYNSKEFVGKVYS